MNHAATLTLFTFRSASATLVEQDDTAAPSYRGLSPFGRSMSAAASVVATVALVGAVLAGFAGLDSQAPAAVAAVASTASHAG